jgi:hypothetical protein
MTNILETLQLVLIPIVIYVAILGVLLGPVAWKWRERAAWHRWEVATLLAPIVLWLGLLFAVDRGKSLAIWLPSRSTWLLPSRWSRGSESCWLQRSVHHVPRHAASSSASAQPGSCGGLCPAYPNEWPTTGVYPAPGALLVQCEHCAPVACDDEPRPAEKRRCRDQSMRIEVDESWSSVATGIGRK